MSGGQVVYCAHYGREMSVTGGMPTCTAGGMPLSEALHAVLAVRFPHCRPRPPDAVAGRRAGRWYCPGCGVPLDSEMACPQCGGSLRDQLFPLVELHPHASEG